MQQWILFCLLVSLLICLSVLFNTGSFGESSNRNWHRDAKIHTKIRLFSIFDFSPVAASRQAKQSSKTKEFYRRWLVFHFSFEFITVKPVRYPFDQVI